MTMTNNNIADLFQNAQREHVAIGDLHVDANLQMRTKMDMETVEHYVEQGIERIIKVSPIQVVWVETNGVDDWYIVDGFHRMHAAIAAGLDSVDIEIVKGTYDQALQYAMSANFRGNLSPNQEDCARAIAKLLEVSPDFGYDSKKVVKYLTSFGIKKRTAETHTDDLRKYIDGLRDAKIEDLNNEGLSSRKIASDVGCGEGTVRNVLKRLNAQNAQAAQNAHPEEAQEDDSPFFDVSEDDVAAARASAQQISDYTQQQEEARKLINTTVSPIVSTNDNVIFNEYLRELEQAAIAGKLSEDQVMTLKHIASLL